MPALDPLRTELHSETISNRISLSDAIMVDHPNAKAISVVVMNLDGEKRVLMVDTDLKMDGEDPAHQPDEVFALHNACRSFVEKFPLLFDTYAIRAWK